MLRISRRPSARRHLAAVRALALAAAVLAATGCTSSPVPSASQPVADDPATGLTPPPGDAVRFDGATLSEDRAALTLAFVGGREYDPQNPCTNHYFGWAREVEGTLNAKIVDDTPPFAPGDAEVGCDAMGFGRTVTIELDSPFPGIRVRDVAGYVHFLGPPDGLVGLTVPAGWTLVDQSNVQDSPTGRWQRTWTMGGAPRNGPSKGKIDLYQAFGGQAGVTGGDEIRSVQVNGTPATLYRFAPDGELVLVWTLGDDGLALVVNETDFPGDEVIELAESATIP